MAGNRKKNKTKHKNPTKTKIKQNNILTVGVQLQTTVSCLSFQEVKYPKIYGWVGNSEWQTISKLHSSRTLLAVATLLDM